MGRVMSGSWKVSLPCTRDEAEAIDAGAIELEAVLATVEEVEDDRARWRLDAYVECEPDAVLIAALRALAPSAWEAAPVVERLGDEDWVTLSQAGLEPIVEGRFFVRTSAHPPAIRVDGCDLLIEASRAFGTGHHQTTAGCLAMLDRLEVDWQQFARIVDIGTGSGLLALAARHLWPVARVVATDIDPAAVEVARGNAAVNGVTSVEWIVADGGLHPAIEAAGPYDLIVANVLAGPLISMAAELAAIAAPGATIVLAGLLATQQDAVVAAWAACGCALVEADQRGDWTILRLRAGTDRFVPASPPDPKGRDGWALDL